MPKFIMKINYGYGDEYQGVEAENLEEAQEAAYDWWKQEAENQAEYTAVPWTEKLAGEVL